MKRSWSAGFLLLLLLTLPALSDNKPNMEDVAGKLACYCGGCPHLVVTKCGCSTADQIKADVQAKIDGGMSEQQIIDWYVAKYGQTVLSAPTRSGFNLTAWIFPFFLFGLGSVVLVKFLKRQQPPQGPDQGGPAAPPSTSEDDVYREQLKREMEKRQQ